MLLPAENGLREKTVKKEKVMGLVLEPISTIPSDDHSYVSTAGFTALHIQYRLSCYSSKTYTEHGNTWVFLLVFSISIQTFLFLFFFFPSENQHL